MKLFNKLFNKLFGWLYEPTYTGPTVEEIKRDMQPDPNHVADPSLVEFGKVIAQLEKNRKSLT